MLNKKGEGEQFNWIFIILSGAIILGFFTMFAFRYIKLQEVRHDLQSIREFGNTLSALEKLPVGDEKLGTSISSNVPGQGLRFKYNLDFGYTCAGNTATLSINNPQFSSYQLENEIIFTRTIQNVNKLDLWLLPFALPFHVTNIIYLSDTDRNYYFVYDNNQQNIQYVKELKLPDAITKVNKISINDLREIKQKSTIIYFTKEEPNNIDTSVSDDTNFIYISLKNKEVEFYKKEWSEPIKYISEQLMYGSFFSDDKQAYECTVQKAEQKLKDTTFVYIEKARILEQIYSGSCHYEELIGMLRKLTKQDYTVVDQLKEANKPGAGCGWVF